MKRQQGEAVAKAPACTFGVPRRGFPWHYVVCIRTSTWPGVKQKCNRSVSSGNVLFHRLIRTKTSEEQGLSLFPDKTSFIMCPCTRSAWRWQCKCIRYHKFSTLSILPGTANQAILLW
ncbi:hypothetical protein PHMEG_00034051 [Phytophthora megakarya]|uniref:Uncharacterized protein n=1 Tax=Phytophthora megakarya TaxID=4795 RepID=A0A225US76_9STRA|nr:hypothetical protein PHMEG_00034051 [Phytophthora megakarya]